MILLAAGRKVSTELLSLAGTIRYLLSQGRSSRIPCWLLVRNPNLELGCEKMEHDKHLAWLGFCGGERSGFLDEVVPSSVITPRIQRLN